MSDATIIASAKRKKQQISIGDYFSKRRRMPTEVLSVDLPEENGSENLSSSNKRQAAVVTTTSLLQETEAEKRFSGSCDYKITETENYEYSVNSYHNQHDESLKINVQIPSHFKTMRSCSASLSQLTPSDDHTILFRPHLLASKPPMPFPEIYKDHWDTAHVRMPCSDQNLYPTQGKKIQKRWELIESTLLQPFQTSKDLEEAVFVYNHHYKDKWNFEAWHSYCNIQLDNDGREDLFSNLLPDMVNLALQLPNIITQSPKLLRKGVAHSLTMSQKQVACLLANAFFCTFPKRNSLKSSQSFGYPDINFSKLFRGIKDVINDVKAEKLKAVLNYFRRVLKEMPTGVLTYTRKVLLPDENPAWEICDDTFTDIYVASEGSIEDNADGLVHVDFANRMIGGGVVGEGCVQEEIRFLICPELIVARLFTEKLEPNESLLITGVERFSKYSGYAQTFKYTGEYNDLTLRDRWGRRHCQVLAIDAHVFHCYSDQFRIVSLKRELDKAYCGFFERDKSLDEIPAIATGNWGCGAFGGDIYVKALLQMMAASKSKRSLVYFTFGDKSFTEKLTEMHSFIQKNCITVSQMWHLLLQYARDLKSSDSHIPLYPYLKNIYKDYSCDTEHENSSDEGTLVMRGVPCEIPEDMEPISPDYAADTP